MYNYMKWPGTADPYKRQKVIRFLIITAIIGVSVAAASAVIQLVINENNPLKACINDRTTPYRVTATLELWVDGNQAEIPANIGFVEGEVGSWLGSLSFLREWLESIGFVEGEVGTCQRSMYTLSNDGTIYAEWEESYPFEIGHFLWMWPFPLRDMVQSESIIYVNGERSDLFINAPFQNGYHYKAEFVSKEYDDSQDMDFLPPSRDE